MACCGKKNKEAPVNLKLNPKPAVNTKFPEKAKVIYVKSDSKTEEFVRARTGYLFYVY